MAEHLGERGKDRCLHLDSLVASSADDFICHEIHTVDFIFMTGQVDPDLERLQVPKLPFRASEKSRYSKKA